MSFRPLQGLTIMNKYGFFRMIHTVKSFRPLQGLTIMNNYLVCVVLVEEQKVFPSPTGVNHYE